MERLRHMQDHLRCFLSEVDHEKYPDVQQTYRFQKVELCENAGDQYGIKNQGKQSKIQKQNWLMK